VGWFKSLVPEIESLATHYHIGNYVLVRGTNERIFESMPIYARIGMHLLFYGKEQEKILSAKRVEEILREQSVKQGKIYDSPQSVKSIPSFIKTYSIEVDELLEPDIRKYKTFNEFFSRKLKPGARPVQNADDPTAFCCCADSRLVVYQTTDLAQEFWVKGKNFTIPTLLDMAPDSPPVQALNGGSIAIFRLAPADYHRFHSPADVTVGREGIKNVKGQYYTVNPQAVNEPGFDVLTANTRSVMMLNHKLSGKPIAVVAVGALLVGSVNWTVNEEGQEVKRGDDLGWFAYGGSTVVVAFPKDTIQFDEDLIKNSKTSLETLVKVGYSLGRAQSS